MRRATDADLDTVRDISADAYAAFQAQIGVVPWPVREDYAPRIARGEVWLAEGDDGVQGLVVLEDHGDHTVLFSVAVRARMQGQGLGKRLLTFAADTARAAGHGEIRLYTNALMVRQIGLYQREGYVRTGEHPHPTLAGHVLVDMTRTL